MMKGDGRPLTPAPILYYRVKTYLPELEFITEADGEDARPQRGLLDYELIGAGEGGRMGIGQVFTGNRHSPGVLRNARGRIDGRVGGILEPQSAGTDGSSLRNRGIRTRLGERIVGVGDTHLSKGSVGAHIPIVAGAHAELHRRRIGARGADRTERVGDRRANAAGAVLRNRLAVIVAGGVF